MSESLLPFIIAAQWLAIIVLAVFLLGVFNVLARIQRELGFVIPQASRLEKGDRFPIDLGIPLPPRVFVAIVSYGCSGCVILCQQLQTVHVDDWQLIVIVKGKPLNLDNATMRDPEMERVAGVHSLPLPSHATVLKDPSGKWADELGVRGVPAVIALVGGRVVDQHVGPPPENWFTSVPEKRRRKGKEVLTVIENGGSG